MIGLSFLKQKIYLNGNLTFSGIQFCRSDLYAHFFVKTLCLANFSTNSLCTLQDEKQAVENTLLLSIAPFFIICKLQY